MTTPTEPTKPQRGACPHCGSKNLRRVREGENEAVIVPKRGCRDCGTVFSPAVSPLLLLVTVPLALAGFAVAVWAGFIYDDPRLADMMGWVAWLAGAVAFALAAATLMILKQREPKIHSTPRGPREAKPWDNPQSEK